MSFIVLDIETGGLSPLVNPILSIGAVDYSNGDEFYGECRAYSPLEGVDMQPPADQIDDAALAVNGFTRAQALDPSKQSAPELVAQFLSWSAGRSNLLAGQQVGAFDIPFIRHVVDRNNWETKTLKWPFSHRSLDLHSVAYAKLGQSLSLDGILKALGLVPEPKPHNALTGARLERDAFKLLLGS